MIEAPGSTGERLLLTPEQAAQVLAVGRSKIYDLLRSEEISSIRIGGSRRIPVSALHEFVNRLLYVEHAMIVSDQKESNAHVTTR